jgi:anthranilate phosphoribosyltransferase
MSAALKAVLSRIAEGATLSFDEAAEIFGALMRGEAAPAQAGALLMGLRQRGETVDEIAGAVTAMRGAMVRVAAPDGAVDCCGTGGDGAHTLNISTATALAAAACGLTVAKHGNRAITSKSGTADVLQALNVPIEHDAQSAAASLGAHRFAFLLAPRFHPAMRHVGPVRQELGFRTLFNLLGPLANPAGVTRQLIGVPSRAAAEKLAHVLVRLGAARAWVVAGADGIDELSLSGANDVFAVENAAVTHRTIEPEDAGLSRAPVSALRGGEAAENADALQALLNGAAGPYRDAVLFNTAAVLVIAGVAGDLKQGVAQAASAIDTGAAAELLRGLAG